MQGRKLMGRGDELGRVYDNTSTKYPVLTRRSSGSNNFVSLISLPYYIRSLSILLFKWEREREREGGRGIRIPRCLLTFHHFFPSEERRWFNFPAASSLPCLTFFIRVFNPSTWIRLKRRATAAGITDRLGLSLRNETETSNEGTGGWD